MQSQAASLCGRSVVAGSSSTNKRQVGAWTARGTPPQDRASQHAIAPRDGPHSAETHPPVLLQNRRNASAAPSQATRKVRPGGVRPPPPARRGSAPCTAACHHARARRPPRLPRVWPAGTGGADRRACVWCR